MYQIFKGDPKAAREQFQQALQIRPTFTCTCLVAQLSKELKDDATSAKIIAEMEDEVTNPTDGGTRTPEVDRAGMLLLDLVKNGNPTPERLAKVDEAFLKIDEDHRASPVAWSYFIGNELESAGKVKEAEKYWRRTLNDATRQQVVATLAGAKLAKHNGTSRPDKDVLEAKDLWPPLKEK
jgi:hypothetical protein